MTRNSRWTTWLCVLSLALVLIGAGGCKRRQPPITPIYEPGPGTTGTAEATTGTGLPEVGIEDLIFDKDRGLKPVYFDFDSYAIRPDAMATLKQNAELIKQAPNVIIQIEGHCDERGTQEYNMALGERRALATRAYLITLGVSGDRMTTISYGEESPADPGHGEAAWAKNRRCEFSRAVR